MSLKSIVYKKEKFFHHYQPVYDIQNWKVIGYESLFRNSSLSDPEEVFKRAKKQKKLYELDSQSVHKAYLTYIGVSTPPRQKNLFINVFPSTIINPSFFALVNKIINENSLNSQQIIFEINENELFNFEMLKREIDRLRNLGIKIAIDVYGKGYSNLKAILELQPDYIKLDKFFMEQILESDQKKEIIHYMQRLCNRFDSKLIVEGVENPIELAVLKDLGIKYAQGYLLGKPALLS